MSNVQDRAMLGKNSPRVQQALRRVAAGAAVAAAGTVPEYMTTAERLALANPLEHRFVYDTDLSLPMIWNGSTWQVT